MKTQWLQQQVLHEDRLKGIQETFAGFFLDKVVNPKGEYYYDRAEPLKPNQDEHLYDI